MTNTNLLGRDAMLRDDPITIYEIVTVGEPGHGLCILGLLFAGRIKHHACNDVIVADAQGRLADLTQDQLYWRKTMSTLDPRAFVLLLTLVSSPTSRSTGTTVSDVARQMRWAEEDVSNALLRMRSVSELLVEPFWFHDSRRISLCNIPAECLRIIRQMAQQLLSSTDNDEESALLRDLAQRVITATIGNEGASE